MLRRTHGSHQSEKVKSQNVKGVKLSTEVSKTILKNIRNESGEEIQYVINEKQLKCGASVICKIHENV